MPVRTRAGSSPGRTSMTRSERPSPPSRVSLDEQTNQSTVLSTNGARQRRDTTTSSEMSSENDLDSALFHRRQIRPSRPIRSISFLEDETPDDIDDAAKRLEDVEEESEHVDAASGTSSLSSTFGENADSESLLDEGEQLDASSLADLMPHPLNVTPASPRKMRSHSNQQLQALPPPRPISMIQPTSALGQAIRAQKQKPQNPLEIFVRFSGKGALEPLRIKIYAPFSENEDEPFDLPLQKLAQDTDTGTMNQTTVGDAIGLCLWRYAEEGLKPAIPLEKQDVNWWTLRTVDDGEVDDDFPALNRASNITDFTSNNNRPARGRTRGKNYDEFGLVEATEVQYQENKQITPRYTTMFEELSKPPAAPTPVSAQPPEPSESAITDDLPFNGIINKPFAFAQRKGSGTLDAPFFPLSHSTPRMGPQKLLKIHFTTLEAQSQNTTVEVTTDTYINEVFITVCKRWNLDTAHHYFRVSGTNTIAPTDRTVETLGARTDLDLVRRRFANAGTHGLGSSPSSSSPNAPLMLQNATPPRKTGKKSGLSSTHPLSTMQVPVDPWSNYGLQTLGLGGAPLKRWAVLRKQPMSFSSGQPKILMLDTEYLHILPSDGRANVFDTHSTSGSGKVAMVPFSMIVGCKVSRRHPKTFRVVVYKENATKRYEFEVPTKDEAEEIVGEICRAMEPFMGFGAAGGAFGIGMGTASGAGAGVSGVRDRADT
jgi:target of rapamycin complex 2 subunit MAPKAP1